MVTLLYEAFIFLTTYLSKIKENYIKILFLEVFFYVIQPLVHIVFLVLHYFFLIGSPCFFFPVKIKATCHN